MASRVMKLLMPKEERGEFVTRLVSSLFFIPFILFVFLIPSHVFEFLCWGIYLVVVAEILSRKIRGNWLVRIAALSFCFFGTVTFILQRHEFGPLGTCFLICIASLTDIGAYVIGKTLKGPKLCPRISPLKTWAGFFGGIATTNIFMLLISKLCPSIMSNPISLYWNNLFVLQILILSAIFGDLIESYFKRRLKVKDMGNLFPGHGGVLDRLDSILMVSIVFYIINVYSR